MLACKAKIKKRACWVGLNVQKQHFRSYFQDPESHHSVCGTSGDSRLAEQRASLYLWGAGWHSFCSRGPIMGEWPRWLMPFLLSSSSSLLYLSPALCVQGSPPPHASMGLPLVCQTTQADSLSLLSPRSNSASSLYDPHSNSASTLHGPHSVHVLLLQGPSFLTQPYFPMASV